LKNEFNIYIVTRDRDLNGLEPYPNIKVDEWNKIDANLMIIFILIRLKIKYLLFSIPIFYFILNYIFSVPEYAFRLTPIANLFGANFEAVAVLHGTPLSFISNFQVALEYGKDNLLLGGGLGSHPYSYDRVFSRSNWIGVEDQLGLNKNSAHSLSIRLLSEIGYIGVSYFTYTFIKAYYNTKNNLNYRIVFLATVAHFVAKSMKLGSYIDYGTPIFICIIFIALKTGKTSSL
jgi:hypothetical protein